MAKAGEVMLLLPVPNSTYGFDGFRHAVELCDSKGAVPQPLYMRACFAGVAEIFAKRFK